MIEVKLTLDAARLVAAVEARAREGIARATVFLHQKTLEVLNTSNPGERRKHRTRKTKSGRAASHTVYASPSQPGEAPRKRTGWLQRNVKYELDLPAFTGRVGVGVNAKYGAYLELGTRRMRPRPWLFATLVRHLPQLRALTLGVDSS